MDRIADALGLRYEDLFEAKPPNKNEKSEAAADPPPFTSAPASRLLQNLQLESDEALREDLHWLKENLTNTDPLDSLRTADSLFAQNDFENAVQYYKGALLDAWMIPPAQLERPVKNFLITAEKGFSSQSAVTAIYTHLKKNLNPQLFYLFGCYFAGDHIDDKSHNETSVPQQARDRRLAAEAISLCREMLEKTVPGPSNTSVL